MSREAVPPLEIVEIVRVVASRHGFELKVSPPIVLERVDFSGSGCTRGARFERRLHFRMVENDPDCSEILLLFCGRSQEGVQIVGYVRRDWDRGLRNPLRQRSIFRDDGTGKGHEGDVASNGVGQGRALYHIGKLRQGKKVIENRASIIVEVWSDSQ